MSARTTRTVTVLARPYEGHYDSLAAALADVCIVLRDGRKLRGEVTLIAAEDGRPRYVAYGASPDMWVESNMLGVLSTLDEDDFAAALDEIESAASHVAGAP